MAKSYKIDMCHGAIAPKLIQFALPLMASSIIQLLFNAADVIVVGRFAGSEALAAVGSTGSLVNLLVNLFLGLSVGSNVVLANQIGGEDYNSASKTIHTSMCLSIIGGILLIFIGIPLAPQVLLLMGSPDNVIDLSVIYLRIYFLGLPALMVYNFGSAILRAAGDTKRPLFYLTFSGIVNVVLNLIFVIVFKMSVAGVALATTISQYLSAFLIVRVLTKETGCLNFTPKKLKFHKKQLILIIKLGLPAGIQSMVFALSNVVLQSAINSFGSNAMAGNAASANIEGFIYVAMNAFYQACLSFTGQNRGAGDYKRIKRIHFLCLLFVSLTGLIFGLATVLLKYPLLSIYSQNMDVIKEGALRINLVCGTYFLCGIMEVYAGSVRGMGYSVSPMLIALIGSCGLRILWVATVFKANPIPSTLFIIYPISWTITSIAHALFFYIIYRRNAKRQHQLV